MFINTIMNTIIMTLATCHDMQFADTGYKANMGQARAHGSSLHSLRPVRVN